MADNPPLRWDEVLNIGEDKLAHCKFTKDTTAVFEGVQPANYLATRLGKSLPDTSKADFKLSEHQTAAFTIANMGQLYAIACSNCFKKNIGTFLGCYGFSVDGSITLKHGACNGCVEINKAGTYQVTGYKATTSAAYVPPSAADKANRIDFFDRAGIPVPNNLLPAESSAPAGMVRMPDGAFVPEGRQMHYLEEYEKKNARIAASEKSVQSYHKQRRSLSPGAVAALQKYQEDRDRRGGPGASAT